MQHFTWTHNAWTVTTEGASARVVVTLDGMYTAHVDLPVRYHNGTIAYDRPEIIPARVKAAVKRAFRRQDELRAQTVNRI